MKDPYKCTLYLSMITFSLGQSKIISYLVASLSRAPGAGRALLRNKSASSFMYASWPPGIYNSINLAGTLPAFQKVCTIPFVKILQGY